MFALLGIFGAASYAVVAVVPVAAEHVAAARKVPPERPDAPLGQRLGGAEQPHGRREMAPLSEAARVR